MAAQRQGSDGQVLRQIEEMWEAARAQLTKLREAVEKAQQLGAAGGQLHRARSEREQALLKLGEAFYRLASRGEVEIPPSLKLAVAEVKAKEEQLVREQSDLSAMLEEAERVIPPSRPAGGRKKTQ